MVLTVVVGVGVAAAVVMVAVLAAKDVNMLNPAALAVEDMLTQVAQVVDRKLERFEYLPQWITCIMSVLTDKVVLHQVMVFKATSLFSWAIYQLETICVTLVQ
jgi:hypothetical protein